MLRLVDSHQHTVMNVEIAQPVRNLDILLHRAAEHTNFAIELLRHVENNL